MRVKMLRKVQEFLLEEPRRFDMANWLTKASSADILEMPPCGTACCIAGAAVIVNSGKTPAPMLEKRGFMVESNAGKILGLTYAQKDRLFFVNSWPSRFKRAYRRAATPLGRARAGVRRIEHFIKTKGKE